jgi:elongation factor 1-alpha
MNEYVNLIENRKKNYKLNNDPLLVDFANNYVFEAGISKVGQISEHSLLGHKLGVRQLIVVVKKMDDNSVIFSEARYNEIVGEMRSYVKKIGYKPDKIKMIPNQRILL